MPTSADPTERTTAFSTTLRDASTEAHSDAEQSPYLSQLLGGELDLQGYGRLVAQHLHIYRTLEATADALRDDPIAGPFVFEELRRLPALEADLAAIYGAGWADEAVPVAATTEYVARMHEIGTSWPGGFVAHHYVRYLGDLSGGLFIGRKLEELYSIDASSGTAFYSFPAIPDPVAFKNAYRGLLDVAPWDEGERARITAEVLEGYRYNTEVLEQLG